MLMVSYPKVCRRPYHLAFCGNEPYDGIIQDLHASCLRQVPWRMKLHCERGMNQEWFDLMIRSMRLTVGFLKEIRLGECRHFSFFDYLLDHFLV
jgi:hypothetical protein